MRTDEHGLSKKEKQRQMRKMRISLRESNFGLLPISFSIALVFIRVNPCASVVPEGIS
jgi:hypothetical protein